MEKGYLKDMEGVKWFMGSETNLVLEFLILHLLFLMYRVIYIVFVNTTLCVGQYFPSKKPECPRLFNQKRYTLINCFHRLP